MKRVWLLGGGAFLVSCTLINSLDELEGGPALDATDGGSVDSAPDDSDAPPNDSGSAQDADVPASKYRAAVMADSPVGYWRLGERAGTVAKDEVGKHDGEYMGGVTLGTPLQTADGDTAVTFDGTTGRIVIGNAFGFTGSSTFSIESWVHIPVVDTSRHFVVSKLFTPDAGSGWYVAENAQFDGLGFGVMNSGLWSEWATPLAANVWIHQVGTYTAERLCAYVNGNLAHCFAPGNAPADTAASVVIGASGSGDMYFKGSIDEVAIYAKELTPARIKAHFDAR